jgi:hypothetical protein
MDVGTQWEQRTNDATAVAASEKIGIGPGFAFKKHVRSGRESEPRTNRLALAMGEVVQRAGRFFSLLGMKAFRFR